MTAEEGRGLIKYSLKRLAMMLLTLFMIITITFLLMRSIPGGPFTAEKKLPDRVLAALDAKYHLNDPLPKQFFDYLAGVLRLDLGPSFSYEGKSVNDLIAMGFPVSAKLGMISVIFLLLVSIPMGALAALRRGRWTDMFLMFLATLGITIPSFILAMVSLYFFAYRLGWVPTYGMDSWRGLILPVLTLSGYSIAFIARLMRSSLLEVMGQDYIRTARAKGMSEARVVIRHALRNAMLPVITVVGPMIAGLLTGSFVIEKIFALPGMGKYFVLSVSNRDYPAIMGTTLFFAVFFVLMNFVVDLLYGVVDPRIKLD